jgi:hypothetical protein
VLGGVKGEIDYHRRGQVAREVKPRRAEVGWDEDACVVAGEHGICTKRRFASAGAVSRRVMLKPVNAGPARFALHIVPPSRLREKPPFSVPT